MARTVFRGANLLDGERPAAAGHTIAVDGDRIVAVMRDAEFTTVPDDSIHDVAGATLMPGMVQSHWHGSYDGLDFDCPPVGLEKPPGYLMLLAARNARTALERGFTSVIGAATGDALDAQLAAAIADGVVEGPRIVACGRWLITTGDSNDLPEYWWWRIGAEGSQRICDGADEFRKAARQEIKEGAEIVKVFCDSGHALLYGSSFVSMTDDELRAVVEAVHHRGKKVRAHVTATPLIHECIAAGVDVLDHADGLDARAIDAAAEAGTFVCPSMYLTRAILDRIAADGRAGEPFFTALQREYDGMREMLPKAGGAGVKLLVGDDWGTSMTPHGDYVNEMRLYTEEIGIAPLDVIRWATVHGAEAMGMGDELGRIEEGRIADLLVVRADPSENIAVLGDSDNLLAVMKAGRFVTSQLEAAGRG